MGDVPITVVKVASPFKLTLNWAALGSVVLALITFFGVDLEPERKAELLTTINVVIGLVVGLVHTFKQKAVSSKAPPAVDPAAVAGVERKVTGL